MKNIQKISISALVLIPALLSAQSVLIDFGGDSTLMTGAPEWNNVNLTLHDNAVTDAGFDTDTAFNLQPAIDAELIGNLKDTLGNDTGVRLSVTNPFDGRNQNGTTTSLLSYPTTATQDSLYVTTPTGFGGTTSSDSMAVLMFSGLEASKTYDFTLFASRDQTTTPDNRNTEYLFNEGEVNEVSVFLDAVDNDNNTVTASGISSNINGEITLTVRLGPGNDSTYAYLGAIEMAIIPEPGTFALLLGAMATGLVMLRRRS